MGLSYTETRRRQLYPAATHRNMSPVDHIWDIIHDHVQADLQRNPDGLIRRLETAGGSQRLPNCSIHITSSPESTEPVTIL